MLKSKPRLDVINLAIQRIKTGADRFSCVALSNACVAVGGSYFGYRDSSTSGDTYRNQYLLVTKAANNGKLPSWWGKDRLYREARIAALKKFCAACFPHIRFAE